ncbi:hypothetical protein G9A89_010628 [Geosiphon pyriformis]|nr:hypothetical protein G9A89_010628 [Geosiphon pyriformis]
MDTILELGEGSSNIKPIDSKSSEKEIQEFSTIIPAITMLKKGLPQTPILALPTLAEHSVAKDTKIIQSSSFEAVELSAQIESTFITMPTNLINDSLDDARTSKEDLELKDGFSNANNSQTWLSRIKLKHKISAIVLILLLIIALVLFIISTKRK